MLPHNSSSIPKSVLRWLWSIKLLKSALGVNNEEEVREWFNSHPNIHIEFERLNTSFESVVKELQRTALHGLQEVVVQERMETMRVVKKEEDI